ncbi:MAG: lipopolysaccharide biosynthesis protein [Kofleriaceae bacterium]|nr:lipopolysaccharide biosynthesis protein [Candidatus Methylomirabilis lanthanidiphila]
MVQLVVAVIVARLLDPKDLGLLGLAVVVAALVSTISDVGIGAALVQRLNLAQIHIRVGFTLSLIAGILATAVVWTTAPTVAGFFQYPEMASVLRLLSLCSISENIGVVSRSLLLRKLDFKRQFWADATGNLVGYAGVSVGLVLLGYGVWGLAVGLVAGSLATSMTLLFMAPLSGGLSLARREAAEILRFGFGVSLTMLASYAATNADYFVVGTWLGTEALGFYRYAYQIAYLPTTFVTAELSLVLFPALAMIRGEPERLQLAYRRALVLVSAIVLPASVAIAISAPELVPVVLGDRWAGVILPLQILCVGGLFRAVYNLAGSLTKAGGMVYQQAVRYILYAVTVFGGSLVGMAWGLTGVSIGVVAALALISILMSQLSVHFLENSWRWFLGTHLPALLVALGVGAGGAMGSALGRMLELPPSIRLALILSGCLGGVVALPTRWLGPDMTDLLIQLAHRIPYQRLRGWLRWKAGETEASMWADG